MQETCSLLAQFGSTELQSRVSKLLDSYSGRLNEAPRDRSRTQAERREKGKSSKGKRKEKTWWREGNGEEREAGGIEGSGKEKQNMRLLSHLTIMKWICITLPHNYNLNLDSYHALVKYAILNLPFKDNDCCGYCEKWKHKDDN